VTARAATLLLLALGAPGALAAASGTQERELRELRGRIEALQKQLERAEETRSEAADALRESERAISEANRALRELGARAREVDARLAALRAEAAEREQALRTQQALLARLLHQAYLAGPAEPLKLLLNGEEPARLARQLYYYGLVSRARVERIAELRATIARLEQIARETEQRAAELAAIAAQSEVQRQRLEREKRARSQLLARLSRDIERQRREIGTLRRDEARLARLVDNLARLVARERPAPRLKNERLPQPAGEAAPFEALKGRLALPVRGELANRFGSPRSDGGPSWKGLFILARPGEEVRAIAPGRVVYADWLRGFGNLLIIDHGGAYMSLYGNNEALYKRVGEAIRGGEAIAAVGASGGNAESGLYFELRHQGRPLDPLEWVEIR
jgi:septal ring factor EnvC (AmiA/AmiB activator)